MTLNENDTIYIAHGNLVSQCKVLGVYTHCTYVRIGLDQTTLPVFADRGLYGTGTDIQNGTTTLFLRKWWHYFPASAIEYIRTSRLIQIIKNERFFSNKQQSDNKAGYKKRHYIGAK